MDGDARHQGTSGTPPPVSFVDAQSEAGTLFVTDLPVWETSASAAGSHPAQDAGEAGLGSRVRRGAVWSAGSVIVMRFANIAIMAVVARIVAPADFGTFTAALTVHAMLVSFAELGVSAAVARSDLDPDEIAPTIVTVSVVSSLALALLMAGLSEQLATFLGAPGAAGPLRVLAITVALIGPFAVPGAQLQREFKQRWLFIATFVSFVASSVVLLVLARSGDGAMAFAWSRVVGYVVMGGIMVGGVSKWYWPGFRSRRLVPLLRFALPLAGANLLSQVLLNVDYVFVGRLAGVVTLGLYTLAFNIAAWPMAVMSSVLNGMILPAFSRIKAEGGDLGASISSATRTVALVACPISALTMVLSRPLISTIYGGQWVSASPVLQVLSLYGVIFVVCLLFSNIIIATGRTGLLLGVQVVALAALIPAIGGGFHVLGIVGVGAAHIVVIVLVTLPTYLFAIHRSTGMRPLPLVGAIAPPLVAALVAAGGAHVATLVTGVAPVQVLLGGLVGALVYVLLVLPFLGAIVPALARGPRSLTRASQALESAWTWTRLAPTGAASMATSGARGTIDPLKGP